MMMVKDVKIRFAGKDMCQVDLINMMGEQRARIFNVNPFTFKLCFNRWQNGDLSVQDAFPMLNAIEREFLLTGILQDEWDEMFGSEE